MNQKFIRIGLTAFVLAASFGGLMWFSLREDTEYYKHVEEVMVSPQQWEGRAQWLRRVLTTLGEDFGELEAIREVSHKAPGALKAVALDGAVAPTPLVEPEELLEAPVTIGR